MNVCLAEEESPDLSSEQQNSDSVAETVVLPGPKVPRSVREDSLMDRGTCIRARNSAFHLSSRLLLHRDEQTAIMVDGPTAPEEFREASVITRRISTFDAQFERKMNWYRARTFMSKCSIEGRL